MGTKVPALQGDWREHSSSDPAVIEGWRDAGYDLAVDCAASGLLVVDVEHEALATAEGLDLPRTYTMSTPRGGKHFFYQGEGPSSVQKLAAKIDTRGAGGYVVWEAAGREVLVDWPVAVLPAWVVPALNLRKDAKIANVDELDIPHNISRAVRYLTALQPVIQGKGADARTYEVAAGLKDLGVSEERAIDLMLEHYNCQPQDDRFEAFIKRKVRNAFAYGQNEGGAQALAVEPTSRFAAVAYDAPPAEEKPPKFKLWSVTEAMTRPKPSFLFDGILPARSIGLAYGPPEVGKTWLMLDMALRVATGLGLSGGQEYDPQHVVYFSGEGFDDLVHSRVRAWCAHHKRSPQLSHFHLLEDFPNISDDEDVDLLSTEIFDKGFDPRLILLDTYARILAAAGLNENDPLDVMKFVGQAEILKRRHNATVLSIHHSGKDLQLGARGSNALLAAVDFAYEITADWSVMALQLKCAKMKAAKRFDPLYYEAVPEGDSLAVRGIPASAYHALTRVEDAFSSRYVGAALAKLGAVAQSRAVTAHVLASALYTADVGEPELEVQAKLDRIARKLNALGKGRLEQYVSAAGWHFPE
jgi:hypothetical protein